MYNVLSLHHVSKAYTGFALKDVSIQLNQGEIVGLVGENGAGKTTLIKLLIGAVRKDGGEIRIFGKDIDTYGKEIKKKTAVVFDQCNFDEKLDAMAISGFMQYIYESWSHSVFKEYLNRLSLPSRKRIETYSRGMKLKLGLATALAASPELLLLDEPTSALDPIVRDEILLLLSDYVHTNNASLLFSSHITSDVEKIADTVCFMHAGSLIMKIKMCDLQENYGILKCSVGDFENMSSKDVLVYHKKNDRIKALIARNEKIKRNLPLITVTIEEILLLLTKGEIENITLNDERG